MIIESTLTPQKFVRHALTRHFRRPAFYLYAFVCAVLTTYAFLQDDPLALLLAAAWVPLLVYAAGGWLSITRRSRDKGLPLYLPTRYEFSKGRGNIYSSQARLRRDSHKPFAELGVTGEALFKRLHGGLTERHTGTIELRHGSNQRMDATPRHGFDKVEGDLQTIHETAIPVLFQHAPTPFNRVIFAVIWWIIRKLHRKPRLVHEIDDPLHKLGPAAVIFRSIVEIEHEGRNLGHAGADFFPPFMHAIHQTIACDLRRDPIHEQFVCLRQQNADGRHFGVRLKVVVHRLGQHATFASPRKRPKVDRRFRIHGQAQRVRVFVCRRVDSC